MIPPIPDIELNVTSAQFENETVIVVLEWTVVNGSFHGLSIVPQVETVNLGPCSRQLVVSYNTRYSMHGEARLCGQFSSHSIDLRYGKLLQLIYRHHYIILLSIVKCISPLQLVQNEQLVITDYSSPAVEGTVALLSCSRSGYELTGLQSAICTRNGEWVPDLRQIQCEGTKLLYYYLAINFMQTTDYRGVSIDSIVLYTQTF